MIARTSVTTFLFTDIEGSTRRWEANADAMRAALQDHDTVLRESVRTSGGTVFKHTGDGMCAAFASPSAAVDAAVIAQSSLKLPVRMGIATGEAEHRDGDYFGAVLNRVARLMAAGHGGQILLDGATAGLLDAIDLIGLGPKRLRDIAKPVDVFQVKAPGLGTEFPPLTTADPAPGNLRSPTTSFVGRGEELAELDLALAAHRLLTLTGVGGVGKTRLALELALRNAVDFPDGVWVIELAAVSDPAAVAEAVASALGITQQPGKTIAESVADALAGRSRLLIFDNCEHVLDAAAEIVEAILTGSTTMKILATSREGLRTADEQLWPVPSLDIESSATTLFVARAQSVAVSVASRADRDAVAEICRRLDGIPLAIELAASRLQSMTVTELRERLHDRFRLLVGSRRGLERHQTLRHAVQWSFELLGDAEQTLLQQCSVFAGGFDLAAAARVTGLTDELATLEVLDALVRKSLVVADASSGRTRFSMLETIRQFAEEQLSLTSRADDTRTAHARYFADRETDILQLWDSPRQREAYAWFGVELANLRGAFRWAADHDDLATAAAIATYAAFLGVWVDQHEPIGWTEELIGPAREGGYPRIAALYVMAAMCYAAGRGDDALGYAEACAPLIEGSPLDALPYEWEVWLCGPYNIRGEPERAVELCRKMLSRNCERSTAARTTLVMSLTLAGALHEAVACSEGLIAAAEATDNPNLISMALLAHGVARRESDPSGAQHVFRRGLSIAQQSGNRFLETQLAAGQSRLAAVSGDPIEALDSVVVAIRNHFDAGSFSLMRSPLATLATVLDRLGYHEPAATISAFAATPFTRKGFPGIETTIAHLRHVLGDERYETLSEAGTSMRNADLVSYAFDQIDRARLEFS